MKATDSQKEPLVVIRYRSSDKQYHFKCLYGPDYPSERDLFQDVSETCSNLYLNDNKIVWVKLFGDSELFSK